MRNGVTLTGNSDQAYLGQRYYGQDSTDLVFQWSDNPGDGNYTPDRLRFIFTSNYTASSDSGARSMEGVEAMRMFPVDSFNVNVGVGDFHKASVFQATSVEPTERLDLVDGRLRIRQLPHDPPTTDTAFVVVDPDGVLHWRPLDNLPDNCEWSLGGGANLNNVWTAIGTGTACPNYDNFVGIGTAAPWAKLHVKWTGPQGLQNAYGLYDELDGESTGKTAGHFEASGIGDVHMGVEAWAEGALTENHPSGNFAVNARANANADGYTISNRGVFASAAVEQENEVKFNWALDARTTVVEGATVHNNFAVSGVAYHYGTGTDNYGGYFESWAPNGVANGYGLYATAAGATNNWAGFFVGDVETTGAFIPSDANLKTGISDAAGDALGDVLAQMNVHTYTYNTDAFPQMNLPLGDQVGLLAQEVEEVAPALVKDAVHPARYNAEGEQVSEAVSYKAVNYTGLVPHLISGHQRQDSRLAALETLVADQAATIAQMQEMLAACCSSPTDSEQRLRIEGNGTLMGKDHDLLINPNPFEGQTTLSYTLERSGRMQLMANSADGKQLRVLHEANMEAGQYQHEWHTSDLSPGVYYVTLLLDGEPIVKKAVKVQR